MELGTYVRLLRRWWWLLTLAAAVGGGASLYYSGQTPPLYRTTATVMVGQFLNSDNPQAGDFTISQQLAQYYAQMATRQNVLQGTVNALRLETRWDVLATRVNAMAPAGSQTIYITVLDGDPARAKAIADEVARQLILVSPTPREREQDQQRQFVETQLATLQARISDGQKQQTDLENQIANEPSALRLQDLQAQLRTLQDRVNSWGTLYQNYANYLRGSRTNYLALTQPAYIPSSPASPATQQNMLLAIAGALVLAAAAALLLEYLDDRLPTPEDAARKAGLPALASVPKLKKLKEPADALVVLKDPDSLAAETFALLRGSLRQILTEQSTSTILVTSPGPGEGKSLTAANLAASFARSGKRTLLVDADLRQPALHRIFEVPSEAGFSDLLREHALDTSDASDPGGGDSAVLESDNRPTATVETASVATSLPALRFVPSGHLASGAGDLLSSQGLDRTLTVLRASAEVIVIDCPPVLPLADTGVIAAKGGIVLLVVDMTRTRGRALRAAVDRLTHARVTLAGISINRAPKVSEYYYRYNSQNRSQNRGGSRRGGRPPGAEEAGEPGGRAAGTATMLPGLAALPATLQSTAAEKLTPDSGMGS